MSDSSKSSFEIESEYFSKLIESRKSKTLGKSDVYTATLNSINTLVGSGLLVLPYALYQSGLILGMVTICLTLILGIYSTGLLIQCKNIAGYDTYAGIGYMSYGRKAVFVVSTMIGILGIGVPIAYFIILSDAITPILILHFNQQFEDDIDPDTLRTIVVISLGFMLAYFGVRREMHELRSISMVSTFCAIVFGILLCMFYPYGLSENDKPLTEMLYMNGGIKNYLKTAPNFLLSFCFQPSFFSVYKSLHNQTDKNAWKITNLSFTMSSTLYCIVGVLSLTLFGSHLKSDLLLNITENEDNMLKYLCSGLFIIMAACHTPVIFFVGKESLLIMYWEGRYKSLVPKSTSEKISLNYEQSSFANNGNDTPPKKSTAFLTPKSILSKPFFPKWTSNNDSSSSDDSKEYPVSIRRKMNIGSTLSCKEYYPLTLFLYCIVVIAAVYIQNLDRIFAITGAVGATVIAFILPPMFFLKLQDGNAIIRTRVFAFIVLMFGVTYLVTGLYANILL